MVSFFGAPQVCLIHACSFSLPQWLAHSYLELIEVYFTLHVASSLSSVTSATTSMPTSAGETASNTATAARTQTNQGSIASGPVSQTVGSAATDVVTSTFTTTARGSAATSGVSTSPGGPENPFPQCHEAEGPYAPFCQPTNGSDVYVGETYYSTKATVGNSESVLTWLSHLGSRLFSHQFYHNP